MKKLISMKEFVLEQNKKLKNAPDAYDQYCKIVNYANILNQPLKKAMFVPCDEENDNLLITPTEHNPMYWSNQYKTATEKVIFEGFEASKEKGIIKIENKKERDIFYFDLFKNKLYYVDIVHWKSVYTIEDLIPYNLELTENFKL